MGAVTCSRQILHALRAYEHASSFSRSDESS